MHKEKIFNKNNEIVSEKKLDWQVIQNEMKNKIGNDIFESWLKKITFVDEFSSYILLSVSTRFIRDWVTSRYLDQILSIVKSYNKSINRIEFVIDDKNKESLSNNNQTQKNKSKIT